MAAQGLQKRQLAFLGPAGHGLGRDVQDVGHLGGPEIAEEVVAALPLGWAATAHPFRAADAGGAPGPVVTGCWSDIDGDGPRHRRFLGAVPGAGTNRTIIETRPSISP
jgi:hypothetical protein